MAKRVDGYIKLQVPAGQANASPPIGPALGQRGVNIMAFCKTFNAQTQGMEPGMPVSTVITIYGDRSFTFEIKTPPASYYIKKAAKLDTGAHEPGRETVGYLTMKQVRVIAEAKIADLNAYDLEAACRMIVGSARSMGVEVRK